MTKKWFTSASKKKILLNQFWLENTISGSAATVALQQSIDWSRTDKKQRPLTVQSLFWQNEGNTVQGIFN